MQRLHAGEPDEAAWKETVGRLSQEKLEADYHASLVAKEVLLLRTKYSTTPVAPESVRAMSDADVHVLWARLRPWQTPEGRAAAKRELDEARKANALDPDLALVDAQLAYRDEQNGEAKAALEQAIARHPNDTIVSKKSFR